MKDEPYVLIIGSSNMDLVIYSERLPNPGETVTGGKFEHHLGGKGANQAVASSRSGSITFFVAKIGNDEFGNQMMSQLSREGINVEHMVRDFENPSGVAFIMVDRKGENMISVAPGANALLEPEDIKKITQIIKNASVIIVQMEIPTETISQIFKLASGDQPIKILNPAPLKLIPLDVLRLIDIIIPNEGELYRMNTLFKLGELTGDPELDIILASRNLSRLGPKIVITTLGSRGCKIYESNKDEITHIDALKVNAIDTVGAGDCFNGIIASSLNKGETIINAVKFATVGASIAVTRKGAQSSMPYLDEIQEMYKNYFGEN
ncbi:MAG: ribokinase [Promethearchaeota archaeon]|nr:MAG: ribokinase [Candidatus Lokiarchaeota archaeon]